MRYPALTEAASVLLRRFAVDRRGVTAVEFAMLLPLMLMLYFGAVEISQGVSIDRKVTLTTRTIADLSSQIATINNSEMTNILNATASVMTPYPTTSLKVVISEVYTDSNGVSKVEWSDTLNGTNRAVGSTVTLPPALKVNDSAMLWAEIQYAYKPTIGYVVTGTLTLSDQMFMRPRLSDKVARVP